MSSSGGEPPHDQGRPADVLALYERAIRGCERREARVVNAVLLELIGSLNFGYETPALRFFRVYDDCLRKVRQQRFDVARATFQGLYDAVGRLWRAPASQEA
jgi:hypothetical protein